MKQLLKLALIGLMSSLVLAFSPETPLHEIPSEGRAVTQSSIIPMSLLAPVRPNLPTRFLSDQDVFLDDLAQRTWAYLSSDSATDNHLPWSWRSQTITGGDYDNPAEIGFYALSWIGAYEMHKAWSPSWPQVEAEVTTVFDQLRAWQTGSQPQQPHGPNAYNGAFYQWYWINWAPPVVGDNSGLNHLVPSIDNAWLAVSLITIREYSGANGHTALATKANAILKDMNFRLWYHSGTSLFSWGAIENPQGGGDADYYSNENRIINFVARALGQLTRNEFRSSLAALVQNPGTYNGITVQKLPWDGSYFTYTAPALFIREISTAYGANTIIPATQAQMAYAQAQGYPVWGLSDCFDVGAGGYVQQGARPAASPNPPETRPGLVTPHASALALMTPLAAQAIVNLQTIAGSFPAAYDPQYGFLDSVMAKPTDPQYGSASARFSALAQEWIFLSLVNTRTNLIWSYFYRDPGVQQAHTEMYGQRLYLPIVIR